ncbi:hypothetical protein JS539_10490 [Bifidobacterium simiarum]|uniref:Uncharacterized protein n=2 Tax=Bifidobacterium simiarum TaxID=2045441 RepID=A0A2M9HC73_9BIFI|nr:hypothetical protein [Bifidobacterium simiarum]PJM74405.1 hypothetical protein CSQ87_10400 [Bifidobacterium simiarum]
MLIRHIMHDSLIEDITGTHRCWQDCAYDTTYLFRRAGTATPMHNRAMEGLVQRITHARRNEDIDYVFYLRSICTPTEWTDLIPRICNESFSELKRRKTLAESKNSLRNPALERLIVKERLSNMALRYFDYTTCPSYPIYRIMAISHPQETDTILLGPLPRGTLSGPLLLADNNDAYGHIIKVLNNYAAILGMDKARSIAAHVVGRYPNRHELRRTLAWAKFIDI